MNILFLTHRLPYAPNRGDRIRAYHLMAEMSRFASVSLFSFVHDDEELSHARHVPFATRIEVCPVTPVRNHLRAVLALPSGTPMTHVLLDAPDVRARVAGLVGTDPPDLVVAYCTGMARLALEPPLSAFPLVLDVVDVDSLKWRRLAERTSPPRSWLYAREARTLEAFERVAVARARASLVVNARERDALMRIAPAAPVIALPNGIDIEAFAPTGPPAADPLVVFCGVMDYAPNAEGVVWFARHVWPLVRASRPDARFRIVGASPTPAVRELAARDPSIHVTGAVPAVQPHLWEAAVAVAPLHVAQGIQNKVLEALAAGLPVVATSAVCAGLPAHVERGATRADAAGDFAAGVLALLDSSPEDRRTHAASAQVNRLSWPAQLAPLRQVLEDAARRRA